MTTTRTRSRGRKDSRSSAAREGAERTPVIVASAAVVVILLIFASVATPAGHVVVAASQHFLLKFAGVFALIALTASAGMGLIATDRIVMTPGHRVLLQAVHRAVSFAALAFLIIHIVLEITAKQLEESPTLHVHVLDAFIPFLSQYRTFYMAEGTIASDIIVLLVATSIVRRRFTASGNAWKWRAIHYSSYAALILGVLHGLLAGRKAVGTYVYWSYGAVVALIALGVLVRFLATSLRSKDMVAGAAPTSDRGATGPMQSMQVRAAALGLMGQISGTMPLGAPTQIGGASGTMAALQAADPGPPVSFPDQYGPDQYGPDQYGMAGERPQAIAAAPDPAGAGRMPRYEPGYDGPPRYMGAPPRRPTEYDALPAPQQAGDQDYDAPGAYDAPTAQWNAGGQPAHARPAAVRSPRAEPGRLPDRPAARVDRTGLSRHGRPAATGPARSRYPLARAVATGPARSLCTRLGRRR